MRNVNGGSGANRVVAAVIISAIALGFVFFTIHESNAKPSYSFSGDALTISGQFGVQANLAGATVTHELRQVPATGNHTNGAEIGNIEKGYFEMGGSNVYLNIMDKNASDYVLITGRGGSKYYINCASPEETNNLYNEISEHKSSAK